mgnify:CR=1 FL=1
MWITIVFIFYSLCLNIYRFIVLVDLDRFSTYTQILHIFIHRDLVVYAPPYKTMNPLLYKAFRVDLYTVIHISTDSTTNTTILICIYTIIPWQAC